MATIYVENAPCEVKDGQNLLHACLSLGFDIPYFCWHPALGSVGACRQCAVKQFKDEKDTQGRIVMSCMTPAVHGTRISIDDEEVRAFRASVIEWLMTNHPHDCPVCDEGGECHLQDMTVMTGHDYRKYRFTKRTYVNQNLGPFINHEMNRCIQCYRCTRLYNDYAGGRDFGPFAAHNHVYFGRHEDGVLENEFSGNLVEVCPTGVFTDKTLKAHYTRPWDLQAAPSVCVHCGLGCNTTPGERYGQLRRIRNRYNGEVNGYFLCDRGRYGYEFVNGDQRVRDPHLKLPDWDALKPVGKTDALTYLRQILDSAPSNSSLQSNRYDDGEGETPVEPETPRVPRLDGVRPRSALALPRRRADWHSAQVIGIGSPRASLESNFALRALVGPDRFFLGTSDAETRLVSTMMAFLRTGLARTPSLREIGESDAVLVLGEDVTNTAPRIALQLRQAVRVQPMALAAKLNIPSWNDAAVREAVQTEKGPLYVAAMCATKLDDAATATYRATPDDLARLGFAVAHAIDPQAPPVTDLDDDVRRLAEQIAEALRTAKRPLVVSGASCGNEAVVEAAAQVAWALCRTDKPASLSFVMPECNTAGLHPLGGRPLSEAFEVAANGEVDTVVILENDLYRRADRAAVDAFLQAAKHVVVVDHTRHETAAKAEVLLPAATFAEGDGTLVSNEGRAQRFIQVFKPGGEVQESWRWFGEIRASSEHGDVWEELDAVIAEMGHAVDALRAIRNVAPPADARFVGQRLPRQPHRYSGRTAMRANIAVSEPKIPDDPDSPFTFSMEGYRGAVPGAVVPSFWSPGWNSIQGLNKFQEEVGGALRGGDPGVRLIEPAPTSDAAYFQGIPAAFQPRSSEWLIVPLYHIFGSEELSRLSPPVAERAPGAYVALNPTDAWALQVSVGDTVEVRLDSRLRGNDTQEGALFRLPVKIRPDLPAGVAGLGLSGLTVSCLPGWGSIVRETRS